MNMNRREFLKGFGSAIVTEIVGQEPNELTGKELPWYVEGGLRRANDFLKNQAKKKHKKLTKTELKTFEVAAEDVILINDIEKFIEEHKLSAKNAAHAREGAAFHYDSSHDHKYIFINKNKKDLKTRLEMAEHSEPYRGLVEIIMAGEIIHEDGHRRGLEHVQCYDEQLAFLRKAAIWINPSASSGNEKAFNDLNWYIGKYEAQRNKVAGGEGTAVQK